MRPNIYPFPITKANELVDGFAKRTSTINLPISTQQDLQHHFDNRQRIVQEAQHKSSSSNTPFTLEELNIAPNRNRDTAPGEDCLTHSMLSKAPIEIKLIMLRIFNKSFSQGKLPSAWKHAILVPIPKPCSDAYRPITLLSCISKVMEILILNRLHFCTKPLLLTFIQSLNFYKVGSYDLGPPFGSYYNYF